MAAGLFQRRALQGEILVVGADTGVADVHGQCLLQISSRKLRHGCAPFAGEFMPEHVRSKALIG